jgi:hypothetical protein
VESEDEEPEGKQRPEVLALLRLIDDELRRVDVSKRELERRLGQGQGYIASVLRERIVLKVEHLWDIGDAIDVEPLVLLYRSAPPEHRERFLKELGLAPVSREPAPQPPPAMTRE